MACPLSGPFAAGEVTFSAVTHGYRTELEGPWCSSVIGRVRGMGRLGAVNGVRELALSVDDPVDGADQGSTSSSILLSRKSMPGLATHLVFGRDRGPGRPGPGTLSHCPPPYENCCQGVIRDDRAGTAGGDWPQDESWAQVAETRAAVVFLAGDWACKLKKAGQSRLPRLSTAEARAAACVREVEFSRNFAPDVYLGGRDPGAGRRVCDRLMMMRRMRASWRLSTLVRSRAAVAGPLGQVGAPGYARPGGHQRDRTAALAPSAGLLPAALPRSVRLRAPART